MGRSTKTDYVKLHYKELAKQCDPKDFWGQVKRTVDGKPIDMTQINLIASTIKQHLKLSRKDCLLDIGCGNGALSSLFFADIHALVGIDYSEYLVSVAKENFERKPEFTFNVGDAGRFIANYWNKPVITKALCYGTFQYFSPRVSRNMLMRLNKEYKNLKIVFLGNLPDKSRADQFYYENIDYSELLDDSKSPIGLWRTKDEMRQLASECGWRIRFHQMPAGFHGAHYRFDAILTR